MVPPTDKVTHLEIHFGKQVVARVRKCRLVVVKNRRCPDNCGAAMDR